MVLSIAMIVLGTTLLLVAFIGCVVPALPGPILGFLALILLSIPGHWSLYAVWLLVVLGVAAVAATVLDNVLPALSSKRAGAGKAGIVGSIIGMIAGSFLSPIGTIAGAFVGALLGEMIFHPENRAPLRAALGVFRGTMLAIVVKLAVTGAVAFFFVKGSISLLRR